MPRTSATLLLIPLLASCGGLTGFHQDTPEARAEQAASVAGFPEKPIRGESIDDFFAGKVAMIGPPTNLGSGRAVPVTDDGYFLTADHVVRNQQPFLFPGFFSNEGRIVWRDPDLDLALIKFPSDRYQSFAFADKPASIGTSVFSGASGGYSVGTAGEGTGNGSYATAGHVTRVGFPKPGGMSYRSTMVARGGMSGGPVVDEEGRLLGIVTELNYFLRPEFGFARSTTFTMIRRDELQRIISEDRKANPGRPRI